MMGILKLRPSWYDRGESPVILLNLIAKWPTSTMIYIGTTIVDAAE